MKESFDIVVQQVCRPLYGATVKLNEILMAHKICFFVLLTSFCEWTDKQADEQTDRQTDVLITILHTHIGALWGEVISNI